MQLISSRYRVLGAGIASLLLVMGLARFAYTPLLPLMQRQAGLGIAEAGWLAAINYAGYLTGALIASCINDIVLKDRLYRFGMVLAVLSTAMMGMTTDPVIWAVSRYLAGLSSAAGMLLGTALILNWLLRHEFRTELGVHFSGVGLGIAASAAAIEMMNRGQVDWSAQWYVLASIGCLLLVPALAWLPAPDRGVVTRSGKPMRDAPPRPLFLRIFMLSYFCAGAGYVVSATFIVAIIDRLPGMHGDGTYIFLVIGLSAAPGCVLWDLVARRMGELNALILATILQIFGILLPVIGHGLTPALGGAILFGGTFAGSVSLVLTMVGRYYPTRPAKLMGKMTISYGLAQIIAPALTGSLAVRLGGYAAGLYFAAVAMVIGVLLLLLLRLLETGARRPIEADLA